MGVPCDSIHLIWVRFAESHISHTVGRYSPSKAKSPKFPPNARLSVCVFSGPKYPVGNKLQCSIRTKKWTRAIQLRQRSGKMGT